MSIIKNTYGRLEYYIRNQCNGLHRCIYFYHLQEFFRKLYHENIDSDGNITPIKSKKISIMHYIHFSSHIGNVIYQNFARLS
jgi:hypothetical protein